MAIIDDLSASGGGFQTGTTPVSTNAEYVFPVNSGKRYQLNISNPGGSTFSVIYYLSSAEQATDKGHTRIKGVLASGLTATAYSMSHDVGVKEIGIEITTHTATAVSFEVLESNM